MAKGNCKNTTMKGKEIKRIVVTGPESTGKTSLSQVLSQKIGGIWIPEYARFYIENLHRSYNYDDVVRIARHQIEQEAVIATRSGKGVIVYDTWLIITKVWFDLVFEKCPIWVIDHIRSTKIDLFLVCDTDLPWVPDSVRENGGEKRKHLFNLYCSEILSFNFSYEIVNGFGDERIENAMNTLRNKGLKLY